MKHKPTVQNNNVNETKRVLYNVDTVCQFVNCVRALMAAVERLFEQLGRTLVAVAVAIMERKAL